MAETNAPAFTDPLLQRFFLSPEEKLKKDKGKQIIKAFYTQQTNSDTNLNFYKARNARQIMLLQWAKGSQPMTEFLDYLSVSDGNKAYSNIDLTQQRIAAQFVSTLVESMAKNKLYPCVDAIDDGSVSEKEQRYLDAIFRMHEVQTIANVQQQSGVQIEPANAYVPDDELTAKVHFQLEDRLPKEIRFEQMLASVSDAIKFERIANRKTLYDHTVLNLAALKIERLAPKQYTIRKCVPTNTVYNFFMNDNGDCEITMIGELYNLKVKDMRSKFGKTPERPNGMSEKELFDLAKTSTQKNIGVFSYQWSDNYSIYNYTGNRPYDDCNVLVFDAEINCGEDVYYVSKTDSFGKENISMKKNVPYQQKTKDGKIIEQEKPENVEIIKKQKKPWMRGVYAPFGDTMLYWGEADLIINQYTDTANPLSSYCISIPNNDGEYVPSLFERIMEPLREYSLLKLKRKQLIAQIRPSGIRIDVESARNIDLGNGDTISWEEVLRIYNQTGTEVWSSKGLDPLSKEAPPITNTVQDVTVSKIVEITNVLAGIVQEIRQLIGVPQYRDGSDVGDRTSGVLQEQQNTASYNVTDYVLNANNQLWEEAFNKLCLLHWNDIVKEEPESKEDLMNSRFKVSVKMRSTDYERERLEQDIQRYSQVPDAQGNPSLTLKDAMFIREIDDAKLARWYLSKTYEENRRKAIADSSRTVKENAEAQQNSLMQKAEQDAKMKQDELVAERDNIEFKSTKEKELALLNGFLAAAAKDDSGNLIKMFIPTIQQLVPNISMPLMQENKQMQEAMIQEQQAQMEQSQQVQQPQAQMEQQPQMVM